MTETPTERAGQALCNALGVLDPWGPTRDAAGSDGARIFYERAAMAAIIAANLAPATQEPADG